MNRIGLQRYCPTQKQGVTATGETDSIDTGMCPVAYTKCILLTNNYILIRPGDPILLDVPGQSHYIFCVVGVAPGEGLGTAGQVQWFGVLAAGIGSGIFSGAAKATVSLVVVETLCARIPRGFVCITDQGYLRLRALLRQYSQINPTM